MATLNVRDFGATGNGVTFDHAAIFEACFAALPGDIVFFPAGTYRCRNAANVLQVGEGVTVRGEGRGVSILVRDLPGSSVVFFACAGPDCIVEDLTFTGRMNANFATMLRFVASVAHGGTVRRCDFTTDDHGEGGEGNTIHAVLTQRCDDILIEDVFVRRMQLKTGGRRTRVRDVDAEEPHNYAVTCVVANDHDDDDISGSVIERVAVNGISALSGGAIAIGADGDNVVGRAHDVTVRDIVVGGVWEAPSNMTPHAVFGRICRDSARWTIERVDVAVENTPVPNNSGGVRIDWSSAPGASLDGLRVVDVNTADVHFGFRVGGEIRGATLVRVVCERGVASEVFGRHGGVSDLEMIACEPTPRIYGDQAPVAFRTRFEPASTRVVDARVATAVVEAPPVTTRISSSPIRTSVARGS